MRIPSTRGIAALADEGNNQLGAARVTQSGTGRLRGADVPQFRLIRVCPYLFLDQRIRRPHR